MQYDDDENEAEAEHLDPNSEKSDTDRYEFDINGSDGDLDNDDDSDREEDSKNDDNLEEDVVMEKTVQVTIPENDLEAAAKAKENKELLAQLQSEIEKLRNRLEKYKRKI
ncbi:hypothetical protein PsorP6_013996 [Peronosclerospora sorghi]|uniref:Uncharacterized protein n=1 Tax=Peronosclerospora sorghi TaxID=230839 RepID=A0ACC0VIF2_9STRA|nr:hypothetical protein PsorP6_013996 [Peronosclerospora sorghi]